MKRAKRRRPSPYSRWWAAAVGGALCLAACANPMPPTGGPADDVPPDIRLIEPADQATSVTADELVIEFTEYIDQGSFSRALSITPGFETPPDISWRGRTATVRFPARLRDNTTYIVQLDTDLRDAHGVALRQPITLAFATGARINQGTITGRVLEPTRGEPQGSIDVFAYASVDPDTLDALPEAPDYRTQTGQNGEFAFRYLPEGVGYYVVAVADANRNRRLESVEAYAPPPAPRITADTSRSNGVPVPWIALTLDTIPPELQRASILSSRRIVIRSAEPVRFVEWGPWTVTGTESGVQRLALPYSTDTLSREVFAVTDSMSPGSYEILVHGLADSSGNRAPPAALSFDVQPLADTVRVRFAGFAADSAQANLLPDRWPEVVFTTGLSSEAVQDLVGAADTAGTDLPFTLRSRNGTRWDVQVPALEEGRTVAVSVQDPHPDRDTMYVHHFRRLPADEMGEISGVVAPMGANIVVEVRTNRHERFWRTHTDAEGRFVARQLPEGQYAIRVFADIDSSGAWTGGQLAPYHPPEPMTWLRDSVRVRARWETALEDTLRLPVPADIAP